MPIRELNRFVEDLCDDSAFAGTRGACASSNLRLAVLQAKDEERRRIARDLHDVTAQLLLELEFDLHRIAGPCDRARDHAMRSAHDTIDLLQKQVRCVSYLMHPPEIAKLGLNGALEALTEGMSARTGIQISFSASGTVSDIAAETELSLFRVAQAALMNIFKHSDATRACVRLKRGEKWITLRIRDFPAHCSPPPKHRSSGVGVPGMQARMEAVGGKVFVRTMPFGTTVTAVAQRSLSH